MTTNWFIKPLVAFGLICSTFACSSKLECSFVQFEPINGINYEDLQDLELVINKMGLVNILSLDKAFGINIYNDSLKLLHYYNVLELNQLDHAVRLLEDSLESVYISAINKSENIISLFKWEEENSNLKALLQFNQNDYSPAISQQIDIYSDTLVLHLAGKDSTLTTWQVFPELHSFAFNKTRNTQIPFNDFSIYGTDTIGLENGRVVNVISSEDSLSTRSIIVDNDKLWNRERNQKKKRKIKIKDTSQYTEHLRIMDAQIHKDQLYILGSFKTNKRDPDHCGILILDTHENK